MNQGLTKKVEVPVEQGLQIHKFDETFERLFHDFGAKLGMSKETSPGGMNMYRCNLTGELVTKDVAFEVLTYVSLYLNPKQN